MDSENNKSVIPKDSIINNEPFLGLPYSKIMSYILINNNNNIYSTSISDIRIQYIENIRLKITLPEIIGKGTVAYKKYYPYHLIKYIEIYFKNPNSNDEILLLRSDNDELLMNLLSQKDNDKYLNYCSGKHDLMCKEKRGNYNDCIIFNEKNITIPIELLITTIRICPETTIIFKLELNNPENMIVYDIEFEKESLSSYINSFNKMNLNFKLEFENTMIFSKEDTDEKQLYAPIYFLRKKTTIAQYNTENFHTQEFYNCLGLSFYTKSNIFTEPNRFIINIGNDNDEQTLINKWVKNILKDLIIVSDLDLTDDNNKIKYGFDKKAVFKEVIDNVIVFNKDLNQQCEIYIELLPNNYKIFYHTNILTFSRRYKFSETINISNLFKHIKGICFGDNTVEIKYILEDIQHDITLDIVSIPVDIWTSTYNTSTGDARSEKNKAKDFIYKNDFILGLDYLSKDKGYNSLSVSAGRDIIDNYYLETKYHQNILKYFKIADYDDNNYPNIAFFNFYSMFKKFILCDKNINFSTFLVKSKINKYNSYDPKSLIKIIPHAQIYELMTLIYNKNNNNINCETVKKNIFF